MQEANLVESDNRSVMSLDALGSAGAALEVLGVGAFVRGIEACKQPCEGWIQSELYPITETT